MAADDLQVSRNKELSLKLSFPYLDDKNRYPFKRKLMMSRTRKNLDPSWHPSTGYSIREFGATPVSNETPEKSQFVGANIAPPMTLSEDLLVFYLTHILGVML